MNLVASAIWSAIGYILGLSTTKTVQLFKTRGIRRFWRPFLGAKNPLAVVLTDKPGTETRSPRKISLTDVQAFSDVRSALALLGREVEIKVRSSATLGQLEKDSFVSLGGPKANGISEQVLSRLGHRLPVRYDAIAGTFEYGGSVFSAAYDQAGFVTRDYGLIIRLMKMDKSRSDSKSALIVFGLHGHGTGQAVKAINENHDLSVKLEPYLNQDLFAFLMFEFTNHEPVGCKVVGADAIH